MRKRILLFLIFFIIVFLVIFSLMNGAVKTSLKDITDVFFNGSANTPDYIRTIIMDIRLPRIIMALLVGMMLASTGTVVQTVYQNPLADPYIIGISASATFGAVLAFILKVPDLMYGVFAFVSCVITSFLIFRLSNAGKKLNTATLLIVGIAVSSFLGAFTSFAMYMIGEDSFKIIMWTMGYLGGATWSKILFMIIPLVFSITVFLYFRNDLDLLMSGEEEAHSMGVNVSRLKKSMLVITALVVAFSVAFSGMIGFVGLIVPHTVRLLFGCSNKKLIPLSTITGGLFLLACDTISRLILAPMEIPIGIITSFFGAPFFLYLAFNKKGGMNR